MVQTVNFVLTQLYLFMMANDVCILQILKTVKQVQHSDHL